MLQTQKLLVFKTHSVFAPCSSFASAALFSTYRASRTGLRFLQLMVLVVGGKQKVTATKDTTGQTGPDTGSVWEMCEQDRHLLLGRKLKFGQEIGTNPPMPAKLMQRGCRSLWGAVTHFPGKLAHSFLAVWGGWSGSGESTKRQS